jgi:serine/threonine protein kinase
MNSLQSRTLPPAKATNNPIHADVRAILGRCRRPKPSASYPRIVSHYELLKEIGRGAKGAVFLASDRHLHRRAAIKMLRRCADHESRRRFLREAECAAALNHPNIVTIYEIIHHQERDFIAMEYVPGKTLDQVIPKRGLPLKTCLDYGRQIAQAVSAIHAAQIIHRDLKPANFVITKNGLVKLLDFGLAKVIDRRRRCQSRGRNPEGHETGEGTILGTVGYMSPEQVRGQPADQCADVFSLGAIFYEMLTGRRAFQQDTQVETMGAILQKTPARLPEHIPMQLNRIIRRCLEKDPRRRYKTAKELLADLTRVDGIAGE